MPTTWAGVIFFAIFLAVSVALALVALVGNVRGALAGLRDWWHAPREW